MTIFQSFNPATQQLIWEGPEATKKEINCAFEAASQALDFWSNLALDERISYLQKYKDFIDYMRDFIAETISIETGKPLWESKSEVTSMYNKVDISIEAYMMRCAEIKRQQPSALSHTRHKPHGIVAVFGPYNFPGHLPSGHIVPALLAGNTIIFKPSEHTPLVGELLSKCWLDSGLPSGVLNLIQGGPTVGKLLAAHPHLNGIFFTGSWPVGQSLLKQFAGTPEKILALEMGGNNPLIFHEAKNIEAAAYLTLQSAYLTSGQRCTCARRLIVVQGEQSEKFLNELKEQMKGITIGPYTQYPEPFMGPLISEQAVLHLIKVQEKLLSLGGKALFTMQKLKPETGFVTPGLMDVTAIPEKPDEEYFGPFLQLIMVDSLDEAIAEANRTSYGLAAGIITDSRSAFEQFYRQIKAGVINWNAQLTGASSSAPFGGIGHSGNFRPGALYAADYCAYPVASLEAEELKMPETMTPGLKWQGKK